MVRLGLYVRLTAKPGKEEELASFLTQALPLAEREAKTQVWFAVRFDSKTFAIFDCFETEEGRDAHLQGDIAAALMAHAPELLAEAPTIEKHEVMAVKLP